jgi:transposase
VKRTAKAVQKARGQSVEIAYVDQGYTGDQAQDDTEDDSADCGMMLHIVKRSEAKRGFVLLPRRWVVERSFPWMTRFRRLAKDFERLPKTVAGLHFAVFACIMLKRRFAASA